MDMTLIDRQRIEAENLRLSETVFPDHDGIISTRSKMQFYFLVGFGFGFVGGFLFNTFIDLLFLLLDF